jgi:hypothetical protein
MTPRNNIISHLFDSKERPFGHTWEYWTTRWWQWFLSISKVDSPAMDTTGEKSSVEQSDPNVWFLAGTTGFRVGRTIRIPSGKAVLLPIINVTISNAEDQTMNTDTDMISYVKGRMDGVGEKRANIDGEDLFISEKFRVQSPPFKVSFPPNNIFGAQEGPSRAVGDGYWIFMRPLQPGIHAIRTYGSCSSGKTKIDANIKLIIENA